MQRMRFGLMGILLIGLPVMALTGWRPAGWWSGDARVETGDRPNPDPVLAGQGELAEQPSQAPTSTTANRAIVRTAWFAELCGQLRDLGAVYLRLERLGGPEGQFRFRCDLPDPGQAGNRRSFVRSAGSAREAAERVRGDVVRYHQTATRKNDLHRR